MSLSSPESEHPSIVTVSEEDCVNLANSLITNTGIDVPEIRSLSDIQCTLFIQLYEKVFDVEVPEIIPHPRSYEEEWSTLSAIINTISLDILKTSLIHISPDDILAGNLYAIHDLLEIYYGYMTYCHRQDGASKVSLTPGSTNNKQKLQSERSPSDAIPVCGLCGYPRSESQSKSVFCPVCGPPSQSQQEIHLSTDMLDILKSDELIEGTLPSVPQIYSRSASEHVCRSAPPAIPEPEFSSYDSYFAKSKTVPRSTGLYPVISADQTDREIASVSSLPIDQTVPKTLWQSDVSSDSQAERVERKISRIICRKSKSYDEIYKLKEQPLLNKETQTSDWARTKEGQKRKTIEQLLRPAEVPQFPYPEQNDVEKLYKKNLERRVKSFLEDQTHYRRESVNLRKQYHQSMKKPRRKPPSPLCKKSFLLPYYLKHRGYHTTPKRHARSTSGRSLIAEQSAKRSSRARATSPKDTAFLKEIKEAFPGIQLSPSTVQVMKQRYETHLNYLHKELEDVLKAKSRTQVQAEEALKRQKILADIMKKEKHQSKILDDRREMKSLDIKVEALQHKRKMDSVKAKQYFKEFHKDFERKLAKCNSSRENLLANKVFLERLNLEKQEFLELKKQLKEQQQKGAQHYKIYLDALENFYQTQFAMLAESFAAEKQDSEIRTKAQKQALDALKREWKAQVESEIRRMQSELLHLQSDMHPRELEAELYLERLRDQYSARPLPET